MERKTVIHRIKIAIIILFAIIIAASLLYSTPPNQSQQEETISAVGSVVQIAGRKVGTGFFYSQQGRFVRILTCEHLINGKELILVYSDEERYIATVIGIDKMLDLAALQIEVVENLHVPIAKLGQPNMLQANDLLIMCGFEGSNVIKIIRAGIFQEKSIHPKVKIGNFDTLPCIQTDISTQPANSGAPLFNYNQEVVGIIFCALFNSSDNFTNSKKSFAIPIENILEFISSLPEFPKN